MPRPRIPRKVWFNPNVTYFKPAGVRMNSLEEVILTKDELESIRLKDYEDFSQIEASKKMGISQPTFQRIYESARKKIANALINGKAIRIEGGTFVNVGFQRGRGMGRGYGRSGI